MKLLAIDLHKISLGALVLTVRDLDGVVCGIGPGSFAGLRIGLSYAKGLAMVGGLPMVGVSSLQMLAGPSTLDRVLTVIDARLSAVYAAAWKRDDVGLCGAACRRVGRRVAGDRRHRPAQRGARVATGA